MFLVQPPDQTGTALKSNRLSRTLSIRLLETLQRHRLGHLAWVPSGWKSFSFTCHLNLSRFTLCVLSLVLLLHTAVKSLAVSARCPPRRYRGAAFRHPQSLPWAQLAQTLSIGQVLQSWPLWQPPLSLLLFVHVSLLLGKQNQMQSLYHLLIHLCTGQLKLRLNNIISTTFHKWGLTSCTNVVVPLPFKMFWFAMEIVSCFLTIKLLFINPTTTAYTMFLTVPPLQPGGGDAVATPNNAADFGSA